MLLLKNIKGRENLIPLSGTRTASSINYQEDLLFSGVFNETRVKIYTTYLHQGGSTKGAYSDQLCKNPWQQFSAWLIPSNEAHQRECCSCIPHHRIGLSHQMSPCQALIAESKIHGLLGSAPLQFSEEKIVLGPHNFKVVSFRTNFS